MRRETMLRGLISVGLKKIATFELGVSVNTVPWNGTLLLLLHFFPDSNVGNV